MITGVHALVYSRQAEAVRTFCRDVLGWAHVDAHDGWLIFALPPAELAVHPLTGDDAPRHELWLMCDDIAATVTELRGKGVVIDGEPQNQGFGIAARITLPDGEGLWIYEPRHASPLIN